MPQKRDNTSKNGVVPDSSSVRFFDAQFERQVLSGELELNPFERAALPHIRGKVLDYGCGLGNLAVTAARQGCEVLALDASPTAIRHLRQVAADTGLALHAREAELSAYRLNENFDTIVCIGLLMFLDCDSALRQLSQLQERLCPGGKLVLNVLVTGTTFLDMFDAQRHCLLSPDRWRACFEKWSVEYCELEDFPAPGQQRKSFLTLIARKPQA